MMRQRDRKYLLFLIYSLFFLLLGELVSPLLVEARRIELLSISPATQTSPSAVYIFTFPTLYSYKQDYSFSSFIKYPSYQSFYDFVVTCRRRALGR